MLQTCSATGHVQGFNQSYARCRCRRQMRCWQSSSASTAHLTTCPACRASLAEQRAYTLHADILGLA